MLDLTKFKVYLVGGWVRDRVLGLDPKDHDFVVVGATPEDMFAAGFTQVGADFPVFLSPITGDEFALARQERKVGPGYHGFETRFDPSISIEQDLMRRDLTINAMARQVIAWKDNGHAKLADDVIDPFNGQDDLKNGVIRHTSEAFAEDPVRVLRAARFAARFKFRVAGETKDLMREMVQNGELDHLTSERVWQELDKAMSGEQPGRFFDILHEVGAVKVVMPLLEPYVEDAECVVNKVNTKDQRFAVMALGLGEEKIEVLFSDLRAPMDVIRVALKTERLRRWCARLSRTEKIPAAEYIKLFIKMDAVRRPDDFELCSTAWDMIRPIHNFDLLKRALEVYMSVNFAVVSKVHDMSRFTGAEIGKIIEMERVKAVDEAIERWGK